MPRQVEHADGGTLFLDEAAGPSRSRPRRSCSDHSGCLAIERVGSNATRRLDIRIIAATNRSLSDMVERALFRPDLFYRLSGVDIRVPTLRERRPDVMELARYFLERHRSSCPLRLSPAASDALTSYAWPGNVRELERLMERAVTLVCGEVIELDDLPATVRGDYIAALGPSLQRNETMRAWGSRYARRILERAGGNKRAACRVLGISYHTLRAYLEYPIHESAVIGNETWRIRDGPDLPVAEPADPLEDEPAACAAGDSRRNS
jgi:two-component system response regulator HydG